MNQLCCDNYSAFSRTFVLRPKMNVSLSGLKYAKFKNFTDT